MSFRDMEKCYVIIDLNNQVWRSFHATLGQNMINSDGINVGCIIGLAKTLNMAFSNVKEEHLSPMLIIAEDRVPWRKRDLYEKHQRAFQFHKKIKAAMIHYKGARTRVDLNYNPVEICKQYLNCIPHVRIYAENEEADDVIASCVAKLGTNKVIHIHSTDKDLWQLRAEFPNVKFFNKNGLVTENDVKAFFSGASWSHIVLHKMIKGDSSDNVLSVYQFPFKKNIECFLNCDGTPEDFLQLLREKCGEDSKDYLYFLENAELLALNLDITKLRQDLLYVKEIYRKPDLPTWYKLCNRFQTPSLYRSPLVNIF